MSNTVMASTYLANTRVTLDSLVYAYGEGHPSDDRVGVWLDPAGLWRITFYLAHRQELDEYVRQGEAAQDALHEQLRRHSPALHQKLAAAKRTAGRDAVSQVRFQADWNSTHIIVQAAQRHKLTLDFRTAQAASLLGVSDPDV